MKDLLPCNLVQNIEALLRTLAAENRQREYARAELRTSFDENRVQIIHYLGEEFEKKLQ